MKPVVTLFSTFAMMIWAPLVFGQERASPIGMEDPNYGWLLVKTAFILVGLCFTAYVGLKYLSKMNLGAQGPMKILGRLPIDGRRAVVVVDIAGKTLIIGSSDAGMQNLGELNAEQKKAFIFDGKQNERNFKDLLKRSKDMAPVLDSLPVEEEA